MGRNRQEGATIGRNRQNWAELGRSRQDQAEAGRALLPCEALGPCSGVRGRTPGWLKGFPASTGQNSRKNFARALEKKDFRVSNHYRLRLITVMATPALSPRALPACPSASSNLSPNRGQPGDQTLLGHSTRGEHWGEPGWLRQQCHTRLVSWQRKHVGLEGVSSRKRRPRAGLCLHAAAQRDKVWACLVPRVYLGSGAVGAEGVSRLPDFARRHLGFGSESGRRDRAAPHAQAAVHFPGHGTGTELGCGGIHEGG